MSHAPEPTTLRARTASALLALALTACATQREGSPDSMARFGIIAGLQTGQVRLGCDFFCSASWSLARQTLAGLHTHGLWADLAIEVVRIGYNTDLAYFYLGRAAEGLGQTAAADVYYRLALASPRKCDGMLFDSCDEIKVPPEAAAALQRLSGKPAAGG